MVIKQAEYITTVVAKDQYPTEGIRELAFVGRSNVGKSSLINLLTRNKKLAKTSGSPGKTRTINYFLINNQFYFVDLPGYGYAKVHKEVQATWGKMMETYLIDREVLKGVVQLVDIRHKPSKEDQAMMEFLNYYDIPVVVAATKSDKISRGQLGKHLKIIKETLGFQGPLIPCSTLSRSGIDELLVEMEILLMQGIDLSVANEVDLGVIQEVLHGE